MATTEDATDDAQTETEADVDPIEAVNNVQDALEALQDGLEQLDDAQTDELNNQALADLYAGLRDAEKATENARKDDIGEIIEDRVDVGETAEGNTANVQVVEGHNKYVKDEQAALEAVESAGIGLGEVMEVNATSLAEVAEENEIQEAAEQVGRYTYTYGRVQR